MADVNIRLGLFAVAAGTADAITAVYSPVPASLYDGLMLWFRATAANTTTTPTFNPNSLGAKTIVKEGGVALEAGDIPGADAVVAVIFDAANDRWEMAGIVNSDRFWKAGTGADSLMDKRGLLGSGARGFTAGYGAQNSGADGNAVGSGAINSGGQAQAIGFKAVNRINQTTVLGGPIIIRKSVGTDDGLSFMHYAGAEVTLFLPVTVLNGTGLILLPLPAGIHFFINEVGVIITEADTVTSQPELSWGEQGDEESIMPTVETTGLTAAYKRQKYIVSTDGLSGTLAVRRQVAATATTLKGRFYFKGFIVEDQ